MMLSPLFWLIVVAVFWGMKWFAEGLMSVAAIELSPLQRVRTRVVGRRSWGDDAPDVLDEAA